MQYSETFGEMSKNISTNLPKVLKKYGEIAKEDKEMIKQMIKIIATSYINILSQREKSKLNDIKILIGGRKYGTYIKITT